VPKQANSLCMKVYGCDGVNGGKENHECTWNSNLQKNHFADVFGEQEQEVYVLKRQEMVKVRVGILARIADDHFCNIKAATKSIVDLTQSDESNHHNAYIEDDINMWGDAVDAVVACVNVEKQSAEAITKAIQQQKDAFKAEPKNFAPDLDKKCVLESIIGKKKEAEASEYRTKLEVFLRHTVISFLNELDFQVQEYGQTFNHETKTFNDETKIWEDGNADQKESAAFLRLAGVAPTSTWSKTDLGKVKISPPSEGAPEGCPDSAAIEQLVTAKKKEEGKDHKKEGDKDKGKDDKKDGDKGKDDEKEEKKGKCC